MAINTEVVRDAPPMPLAPVDESVLVPESVRRNAAAIDALYKPQPDPAAAEIIPQPDPAAAPVVVEPVKPAAPVVSEEGWQDRYNAMKGRYEQSQRQLGEMQSQLTQMGGELSAVQTMIRQPAAAAPVRLITEQEEKDYGQEFLGVVRKAAQEEFSPVVDGLKHEVTTLRDRLAQKASADLWATMDREVPDWRTINRSSEFKSWLALREPYSGAIRKVLLNDAFQAADAPRVLSFFRGFVTDEAATGSASLSAKPAAASAPVRTAAVSLATLAAPGRAQSSPAPAAGEKPVFTTAQIRDFYADVRRQVYLGRETEKNRIEASIFEAQREGRVRG